MSEQQPRDTGRPGPSTSEAMRALWEGAARMDEDLPCADGARWVPRRAVWVDYAVLPRTVVDEAAVARYRAAYLDLPPIVVQQDTFKLIGGLHRLSAGEGVSDFVRARERPIDDAHLEDAALEDNAYHGLPLSMQDRLAAARKLFARHHPDRQREGEAWTVDRIARLAGISADTVGEWLKRDRQGAALAPVAARRIGADGKTYAVREASGAAAGRRKPATSGAGGYQNAAALRPVAVIRPGGGDDGARAAAALDRLREAVEAADERIVAVLDDITPEQAGEVYHLAERMAAMWGKVADAALRRQAEASTEVTA